MVDRKAQSDRYGAWGEGVKQTFDQIAEHHVRDGFWYLLSPYSLYSAGRKAAFTHAARIAAALQSSGLTIFSPIVHFHPLALLVKAIPSDNDYWMGVNRSFMNPAIGGILAELPGWELSDGISREIAYLGQAGKPVIHLPVPSHLLRD